MSFQQYLLGKYRIVVYGTHEPSKQINTQKVIYMDGETEEDAKEKAKMYFIRLGYQVHHVKYLDIQSNHVDINHMTT